jgi:5'-methylthioadenosine phosphorylase
VDFTRPYDESLRVALIAAAAGAGEAIVGEGVYAATQGPRLETAAEIDRLERDGATVVGMTGMPEAVLARELGLAYGAIVLVVNHAAGRGESREGIHLEDIKATLQRAIARVRRVLEVLVNDDGRP